ncbi:MAG: hypothetical protein QM497_08720 [Sulfurimonas sp.]
MKSLIFTVSIVGFLSYYFFDSYKTDTQPIQLQNTTIIKKDINYINDEDIVLKSEDIVLSTVTQSFDLNKTTTYKITTINDIKVVKILKKLQCLDNEHNTSKTTDDFKLSINFNDIELASLIENNFHESS